MKDLPDLYFMVFDRYEIHIRAFGDVFYGKFSFFTPHQSDFAEATNNLVKLILTGCGLSVPAEFE